MDTYFSINEAIKYMKDNLIVTTNNQDNFSLSNDKINYRFNGSSSTLSLDDFNKLFKDSKFRLIDNDEFIVDELKDKEYYQRYKK